MVNLVKEAGIPDWGARLTQQLEEVAKAIPATHGNLVAAHLPAPSAKRAGARGFVTDANATTFASIVAGGGTNGVPVYCDGVHWRIG